MSETETNAAPIKPPVSKIDAAAEQVIAQAAVKVIEASKSDSAPAQTMTPASEGVKAASAPKTIVAATTAPAAKKTAVAKPTVAKPAKKAAAAKTAAKKPVSARKAAKPVAAPKTNPVTKLKDTIMATANKTDITATTKNVIADVQTRAKTAAAKGTELASEATEFTKANVEAVVESGKIFFTGAQELLKDNVETGKTVLETVTEDAKKVAAVKSPTELMQLQNEIVRRNFDAMVSYGSKRTEAWVKLYNEAFAPISNRVSVAAEKIKTAA
ncbi:MAG: phasin family protein [Sphingomonadales bacterium]|nr:phasin family protein [Sphingomonadales bacterium]NCQ22509.1 phasin family protein [Sphingomonadales bacterium]NCT04945.1 phasin family protein [Sphingomonadales bacterium]